MSEPLFHRVLDRPWVFRLQQAVLAAGIDRVFARKIRALLLELPPAARLLDVGCGPASWLWRADLHPVGADLSWRYMREYAEHGDLGVVASADGLPFRSASFEGIWSIGLLHHLPDPVAAATLHEMVRVCQPGGYLVVLDAVLPRRALLRPLAYVLRQLDRGRFVRSEHALLQLLPRNLQWQSERFTFAITGLEAVVCWSHGQG